MYKKNYINNNLILSLLLFLSFGHIIVPSGSPAQPIDPVLLYNQAQAEITRLENAEPARQQEQERRHAEFNARIAAAASEAERLDLIRQHTAYERKIGEENARHLADLNVALKTRLAAFKMMYNMP